MATLADYLSPGQIAWLTTGDKPATLKALLGCVSGSKAVKDAVSLESAIFDREVKMSTGVGYGVAVPHARIPEVENFVLALGIAPDGVNWESEIDDQPVKLVCMIAGPNTATDGYLKLLSSVMKFVKSEKGKLLASTHPDEVMGFAARYPVGDF